MTRRPVPFAPASLAAALLAGCGSTPPRDDFPAQPEVTVQSTSGTLTVEVRTSPEPPTRGNQDVEYTVTDTATSRPVAGIVMTVLPWMPRMNHGTSVVPTVRETKPGVYLVSNVAMFMSGEWALETTMTVPAPEGGAAGTSTSDHVSPELQIP